jgi:hypothetical protein
MSNRGALLGNLLQGLRVGGTQGLLARGATLRPGLPPALGYTTAKYYGPSILGGLFSTGTSFNQDIQFYAPFLCRKRQAWDRIALRNTAAVSDKIRLALYGDDGGGHPGARLAESGEITLSGAAADNAATVSVTTDPGLYWLSYVGNAAIAVEAFAAAGLGNWENWADFATVTNATAGGGTGAGAAFSFAQLPATATVITTLFNSVPYIRLRAA